MPTPLAPTIPSPLAGGTALQLRFWLPHVWTQAGTMGARSFGIYWSHAEGIGCVHPQPTSDELRRFYDTAAYDAYMGDSSRGDAATATKAPAAPSFMQRLLTHVAWRSERSVPLTPDLLHGKLARTPARICDLGCGAGGMLRELAGRGHEVLGVDPNPTALANAARIGLRVVAGTAEDLPTECPRDSFDVVVMSHSLEHCRDPLLAMRNAASLLAAGGLLVCDVPNHACAGFALSGPAWFHTDAGRHLWFFTPASLAAMAGQVGLRDATFEYEGYSRQFNWLAAEQEVWDALYGRPTCGPAATPPRPSRRTQIGLLCRTLCSPPERRYDSVRLLARKA